MEGVSGTAIKSEKEDSILVNTEYEGEGTHYSVNLQENVIYIKDSPWIKEEPDEIPYCFKKEMRDGVEAGFEGQEEFEAKDRDCFPGCMQDLTEMIQISPMHVGLPEVFEKVKGEILNDPALKVAFYAAERGNIKPEEEEWHQVTSDHQSSRLRSGTIFGKEFGCGKDPVVRLSPEKIISLHQNLRNFEGPEENLRRKSGCEREAVVKLASHSLDMEDPVQGINSGRKLEPVMKETVMPDSIAKSLFEGLTVAEGPGNHLNNKGGSTELKEFFPVREICDQSPFRIVDENYLSQGSPINSKDVQLTYNDHSFVANNKDDINDSCITQNKEKKFACPQCSFKTNDKKYLRRHHLAHSSEKKFACSQCSFKTKYKNSLNAHCRSHSNTKKFACDQCSYKTNVKKDLTRHYLIHGNIKKFACDQCSYKTNYRNSFYVHCLNHSNVKKFVCGQCSYKTNNKSLLTQHCLSHSNIKMFACDQCSYKTNTKENLTQHCLNHSNFKKFSCDQCSYKTNSKSNFTQHCLNHSNFKKFACDQCSYKTNKKGNLTRHGLTHVVFEKNYM